LGPFGTWSGGDAANHVVKNADLLLIVGVRFDFDLGSVRTPYNTISPKTQIIQINRHPETLGLLYPVELGAAGSIAVFLQDLREQVEHLDLPQRTPDLKKLKTDWDAKLNAQLRPEARPIQLEYAISVIKDAWAKDRMLLADVGNFMSRTRAYYDTCQSDSFMIVEAFSALGTVFPTALGAQMALPDRQVVCLNGDGAFFLNMAEMETSVRENLPVKVFIFNDLGYGSVATRQKKAYAGRIIGTEFKNPNFANVAREFGVYGEQISDPHDLPGAVRRAFAHDGPVVLDILTARE
jgi:pyruvate dehydrogenase (quinone)